MHRIIFSSLIIIVVIQKTLSSDQICEENGGICESYCRIQNLRNNLHCPGNDVCCNENEYSIGARHLKIGFLDNDTSFEYEDYDDTIEKRKCHFQKRCEREGGKCIPRDHDTDKYCYDGVLNDFLCKSSESDCVCCLTCKSDTKCDKVEGVCTKKLCKRGLTELKGACSDNNCRCCYDKTGSNENGNDKTCRPVTY